VSCGRGGGGESFFFVFSLNLYAASLFFVSHPLLLLSLQHITHSAPTGLIDVVLSYCHCCPTDHALDAAVPYFAGRGLGIISASPLSMGLLTPQGPPPWHPAPPALRAAAAAAVAAVTAAGFDAPALALRDALETPGVATHLIGLSTRAQVRVAVASALAASAPPQAAEAAALAEMRALLAPVLGTTWPSGRLENN
jgi:L-galactose dehydrogenase